MYLETLVALVQDMADAQKSSVARKDVEIFVEKKLGLLDCSVEEREAIESNCVEYHDFVMSQAEIWLDSMRQDEEEYQNKQILMAEFHPSNLNK